MTFNDLVYFETIAREESLTRAARILYISQPTLSKFIQRLQNEVGLALFEHIGKRVVLTYAGKTYLTYVQRLLSTQRQMEAAMLSIQQMQAGVLRVGMPPFRCSFALPRVLPEFHRIYPQVEFSILQESSESLDKALRDGAIDLAFYNLSRRQPGLSYELLEKERLFAVLPQGHPIAERAMTDPQTGARRIRLEWLKDEVFLIQNRTQRMGQYIMHELEQKHIQPRQIMVNSNIRASAYLAANGYGVAFLTNGLLKNLDPVAVFDCYELADCEYPMYYAAAWRESSYLPEYAQTFIRLMSENNGSSTHHASDTAKDEL